MVRASVVGVRRTRATNPGVIQCVRMLDTRTAASDGPYWPRHALGTRGPPGETRVGLSEPVHCGPSYPQRSDPLPFPWPVESNDHSAATY